MIGKSRGNGKSTAGPVQQGPQQPVPLQAPKISLDQVLSSTNFTAYQMVAGIIKNYEQMGNHPSFNPNVVGRGLYNALGEMQADTPNKGDKLELGLLLDALQKNLQNGTLTKQSFEATLEHAKTFLGPYANKLKGNLEESHYKAMVMGVLRNQEMFGGLYATLITHPTATRAARLGNILKEVEDNIKKQDISSISKYYSKLMSPNAVADYVKSGKTPEEAQKIVDSGKKAYESLIGSLDDRMKTEHQKVIQQLVANAFYMETGKIDLGHIKTTMAGALPHDILALMPYGRRNESSE